MIVENLPYISWSRFSTFVNNKKQYIKRYIKKEPTFTTKEMEFGKNFHELMEITMPPFLSEFEGGISELKCTRRLEEFSAPEINLLSIIDKVIDDQVIEFKTGKKTWTQKMADEHGQLFFEHYALHGMKPGKAKLVWIETYEDKGQIRASGRKEVFEVDITLEKLEYWLEKLKNVYYLILIFEQEFMKTEAGNDKRVLLRETLLEQIAHIQKQVDEIDEDLKKDLLEGKIIACDFGTFFLKKSNRKTYDGSSNLEDFERLLKEQKNQKDAIKELMGKFELSPIYQQAKEDLTKIETELDDKYGKETEQTLQFRKNKI